MTIVEELRRNRESGAKRLEAEYKAGLMTLAKRFCADHGDAEELVNRTFAAVVEGIDDYLEQSAFFGWMCQILSNIHAKDVRNKAYKAVVCQGDVPDVADDSAVERMFREIDTAFLRDAIETLPKEMKEAVIVHYFMEQPVSRVAKFLALPVSTVKWRLHVARAELARRLGATVRDAAKKPGGKALLLALALCGLAALGAGLAAAVRGAAGTPPAAALRQPTADTRQPGLSGPSGQTDPSDPSGTSGRTVNSPFPGEQNMNASKTTQAAAILAAGSMALAADGGEYQYIVSGDPAVAAVSGSASAASATGPLDVRLHSSAESGAMALSSIKGTGFFIILH